MINFIIKLLKLENSIINIEYNNILIIIDKFIKYVCLISYNKKSVIKQIT